MYNNNAKVEPFNHVPLLTYPSLYPPQYSPSSETLLNKTTWKYCIFDFYLSAQVFPSQSCNNYIFEHIRNPSRYWKYGNKQSKYSCLAGVYILQLTSHLMPQVFEFLKLILERGKAESGGGEGEKGKDGEKH